VTLEIPGSRRSLSAACSGIGQNLTLGTRCEVRLMPHSGGSCSWRWRSAVAVSGHPGALIQLFDPLLTESTTASPSQDVCRIEFDLTNSQSSNFTGCWMGMPDGSSPVRTLSVWVVGGLADADDRVFVAEVFGRHRIHLFSRKWHLHLPFYFVLFTLDADGSV
jgi:hypothetical protein